jgi:hypothetical protein
LSLYLFTSWVRHRGHSLENPTRGFAPGPCARETGERWTDAFLHRIRGEILFKCDPANTAPTEEAFLTAITIAQEQKARSFELRAALALAKLYQTTGRAADAHAVLAPSFVGFSPTPEFPEIEEAQALRVARVNIASNTLTCIFARLGLLPRQDKAARIVTV